MLNKSNILILLKGGLIAQFLPIISYPIITRLFATEDFGLYSTILSIITTFTVITILKLDQAIPIANLEDKKRLIRVSLFSNTIITIFAFIIINLLIKNKFLETIDITSQLLLVIAIFLNGLINLFIGINVSKGKFKNNASNQIIRAVILTFLQVLLGYIGFTSYGLLISFVIAQALSLVFLLIKNKDEVKDALNIKQIKNDLYLMKKSYLDFLFLLTPTQLINTMGMTIPIVLITSTYGLVAAGLYGLVTRAFMTPLNTISLSIAQPLFKEMSDFKDDVFILNKTLKKAVIMLSLIAIVPLNLVSANMEYLFSIVFSSEWEKAGTFALFIIPWISINFILSPISNLYTVLRKQHINLIMNIIITVARVSSILICYKLKFSMTQAILAFGIISFFLALAQIFILFSMVKLDKRILLMYVILPLIISLTLSIIMSSLFSPIISLSLCCVLLMVYIIISLKSIKEVIK